MSHPDPKRERLSSDWVPDMEAALLRAVPYIKQVRDEAEVKHDTYGDYYMDGGLYAIMQEADALLAEIEGLTEK